MHAATRTPWSVAPGAALPNLEASLTRRLSGPGLQLQCAQGPERHPSPPLAQRRAVPRLFERQHLDTPSHSLEHMTWTLTTRLSMLVSKHIASEVTASEVTTKNTGRPFPNSIGTHLLQRSSEPDRHLRTHCTTSCEASPDGPMAQSLADPAAPHNHGGSVSVHFPSGSSVRAWFVRILAALERGGE
jgi:hypothetical protein